LSYNKVNMSQKNDNKEIIFVVDRFEGTKAVLRFEDQDLVISKKMLPKDIKEGDALITEFVTDKAYAKRQENLAKAILEEILKGE
jgi:hypothetical protein